MKVFYRFILLSIFASAINLVHAQFGVRIKYNNHSFSEWETAINNFQGSENKKLFNPGLEAGLDYWFRLKKRRVEFMPEISYSIASSNFSQNLGIEKTNLSVFSFNFNTQIYALDMEGDCDCPTFSKQGASINKGLFFHFTPGIGYYSTATTLTENITRTFDDAQGLVFRAGLGVGLDLGVSDLITITPIISYYFHSNMQWDNMPAPSDLILNSKDSPKLLQFTLRFGFRPDYGRHGRRRR